LAVPFDSFSAMLSRCAATRREQDDETGAVGMEAFFTPE
jgi:hypothetical protein